MSLKSCEYNANSSYVTGLEVKKFIFMFVVNMADMEIAIKIDALVVFIKTASGSFNDILETISWNY